MFMKISNEFHEFRENLLTKIFVEFFVAWKKKLQRKNFGWGGGQKISALRGDLLMNK